MPSTVDLIAARAGVSSSTVARVLRGDVKGAQKRSKQKATEILQISEELGYQPDWRARAFKRGKTHSIGLLYSDPKWIFDDPMNEISISFTESLQQHGYDLRLIPVSPDGNDWRELVLGRAVDGLALLLHVPEGAQDVIDKCGLPVVSLAERYREAPSVMPDDVGGAYSATRHLLGLGHKRIVYFVSETIRPHVSIDERRQGYEKAMREAGLDSQIDMWHCGIDQAMDRVLTPDGPTAVLGYCHIEALQITQAAWAHGLAIPTNLSLVAFNDMPMTACMTPPLTVVGFDTAEVGRLGADLLVAQVNGEAGATPINHTLRERLVIRGTTAPPGQHRQ